MGGGRIGPHGADLVADTGAPDEDPDRSRASQREHERQVERRDRDVDPDQGQQGMQGRDRLADVQRKRLLHEDVLAMEERLSGEAMMERGGSRDGDGLDRRVREGFGEGQMSAAELLPKGLDGGLVGVHQSLQGAEGREITHQVLAPITAADDREARGRRLPGNGDLGRRHKGHDGLIRVRP